MRKGYFEEKELASLGAKGGYYRRGPNGFYPSRGALTITREIIKQDRLFRGERRWNERAWTKMITLAGTIDYKVAK